MIGLFLSVLSIIQSRAVMANSKSFRSHLKKSPFSLVLFRASHDPHAETVLKIMDSLTESFAGRVSMIMIDIDASPDLAANFSISSSPTTALFAHQRFLRFYKGEWSQNAIAEFCDSLFHQTLTVLHNQFEVYEFQKEKLPVNIVVGSPENISEANATMQQFFGSIHVGILNSSSLGSILGIGLGQLTRPIDNFVTNLTSFDPKYIETLATPLIELLSNQESFGNPSFPYTVCALLDERDPLQIYEISKMFNNISNVYGQKLAFQICDYYRCTAVADQLGIMNFGNPLFVLSSRQKSRSNVQLLPHPAPQANDLKMWLDKEVLGIEHSEAANHGGIPQLYARNFMSVALDPHKDVILLMAVPGMPQYKEAFEKAKKLIEIFQPVKTVEFYEFNPKTQLVPGLQMPPIDRPIFSIWPASEQPSGVNVPSSLQLPAIVDTILKTMKSRVDPTYLQELTSRLEKISEGK